jgi:hypothetical protein
MIARKQLLTIALILGGLGLIGVFAISTNTLGIRRKGDGRNPYRTRGKPS